MMEDGDALDAALARLNHACLSVGRRQETSPPARPIVPPTPDEQLIVANSVNPRPTLARSSPPILPVKENTGGIDTDGDAAKEFDGLAEIPVVHVPEPPIELMEDSVEAELNGSWLNRLIVSLGRRVSVFWRR